MKKAVIASLAVLASAAALTTFALAGAGKFGDVRVNAGTKEYNVTFDGSESTTVEAVGGDWVISTTTENGNKVGMVGDDNTARAGMGPSFCDYNCYGLFLCDHKGALSDADALQFSTITGFTVVFEGSDLLFIWEGNGTINYGQPTSGTRFDVTCTPWDEPSFQGYNKITSLTIFYTC